MPKRSEIRLTKRAVDALEVEDKDAVFWDRELAGFGVRVYPTARYSHLARDSVCDSAEHITCSIADDILGDDWRRALGSDSGAGRKQFVS